MGLNRYFLMLRWKEGGATVLPHPLKTGLDVAEITSRLKELFEQGKKLPEFRRFKEEADIAGLKVRFGDVSAMSPDGKGVLQLVFSPPEVLTPDELFEKYANKRLTLR